MESFDKFSLFILILSHVRLYVVKLSFQASLQVVQLGHCSNVLVVLHAAFDILLVVVDVNTELIYPQIAKTLEIVSFRLELLLDCLDLLGQLIVGHCHIGG